ncbi:hypothetical protein JVT61DRAFT_12232 [Boletus reticuloceps]|uniref:Zn(2)-C6 fungal-type domain-containing protein n=1 Tax=Boletus reticuloceps TaxID=495285 RepID=A0A8I3A484_9AGAM|nr:hypothetical protein JVT61DRAFT_12232 [Boletus reticuloceps]
MSTPENVDDHAFRVSVRIQAALATIPRLVGPRHAWVSWMRVGIERELLSVEPPSMNSPHPALLGSLRGMLSRYYSSRLNVDVLHFEDLRAEDLAATAPEYVTLPLPLPELGELDRWWESPPPSVSLKDPSPPPQPSRASDTSVPNEPDAASLKLNLTKLKKKCALQRHKNDGPSQAGQGEKTTAGGGSSRIPEVVSTGKKRPAEEEEEEEPRRRGKRTKRRSRKIVVSDDDDDGGDVPSPGPSKRSNPKGKARAATPNPGVASEEPEGSKVCEACRSRGFDCVWPAVDQSTSASQNEKRACTRCASQKTRCYITGVFSIRRPRGKAAASQPNPLQDTVAKQQQEISEVKEQMKKLATKLVVHEQEKAQLLSSVSALQATVAQMSLKLSSGP